MGIVNKCAGAVAITWADQDGLSPCQESLGEGESGPAGHEAMEGGASVKDRGTWGRWRETYQVGVGGESSRMGRFDSLM